MPTKKYLQHKESNARYLAKQSRLSMCMKPEDRADFEAYAATLGESLSAFLIRAAKAEMQQNPIDATPEPQAKEND